MNDRDPYSALREWRAEMRRPAVLAALAAIAAVLGLAGPFGTDRLLPLVARIGYWLVTVFATYGAGVLAGALVEPHVAGRPRWQRVAAVGVATGAGVSAIVLVLNLATFGWWPDGDEWLAFVGTILAIAMIITIALDIAAQAHRDSRPNPGDHEAPPPLLERLPLDKRGALVSLSVEDHYVRVRTLRDEAMILMRLSDAIREVGQTPGAQVHRSHWAAFGQVRAARRTGDRAFLTMATGDEIPVSRGHMHRIKEAGLLPR